MDISNISRMNSGNIVSVNPNQLEIYADTVTINNLKKGDAARAAIKDAASLERYQTAIKESFKRAICGMPEMNKVNADITGKFESGNLICESLTLETLPGYYATANVYKPLHAEGKLPAVLMVCGHAAEGRMEKVYQRVQRTIASAGFVVMGLDPVGQGERISYFEEGKQEPAIPPCTKEHDYAGAQCLLTGLTITRYFVHDGVCALDYLASRDDVDAAKIGLTGSSGGGTQTSMLMMYAPEKIAAAAPATFISDRKAILYSRQTQDLEQIWPGMVSDGFDHADILACMAPKPVMLLTVDSDYFPLEGAHRTLDKAKPLWKIGGKENALEIYTDTSCHAYTQNLANAAADFFSRALKGKTCAPIEAPETQPVQTLYATKDGSVVKSLHSRIIHDFVLDELNNIEKIKADKSFEQRRKSAKRFIEFHTNNYEPYPLYLKRKYTDKKDEYTAYNLQLELFTWFQQEGIHNFGICLSKIGTKPQKTIIALWDGGTTLLHKYIDDIMDLCEQGCRVFVVDLTGTGTVSDGLYNAGQPDFYYTRMVAFCENLLVNGDSLPAMRVRGICKAVDAAENFAGEDAEIGIVSYGLFSLYALMAGLIDNRIKFIEERNAPKSIKALAEKKYYSHNNIMAVVLPGMLREFDLDDLRSFFNN